MALGALVFCGGTAWYFWPKNASTSPHPDIAGEFEGMYVNDFSDLLNTENRLPFQIKNEQSGLDVKQEIRFRVYYDFRANSDFVSIYIPSFHDARMNIYDFIHALRDQITLARDGIKNSIGVGASAPGTPYTSGKDLKFSGRVFIYTLNNLDAMQLGQLVTYYREAGIFLEIRGSDYYWFHRKH
jgi:hypothetical protein